MNSEFFNQKLVAHIQMLWKQLSLLTFSGYRFSVLSRPCSKIQHATGEKCRDELEHEHNIIKSDQSRLIKFPPNLNLYSQPAVLHCISFSGECIKLFDV